ncbi:hypothetical protein BH18THE2_BH18THE2_09580 [soil metagenome]
MANFIKLKSLKEPSEESDGFRILIARYRPRYLPKYKENWDEWWKDLAPSRTLWKDYLKDKKIDWPVYVGRFIFEIRNNTEAVNALRTLASTAYREDEKRQQQYGKYHLDKKNQTVTLLCHCIEEKYCHRSIVKGMIQEFKG